MENLRKYRKAKGLLQKELADMVGVSESSISQYESGKKQPSFEIALKLAEALDCESADLVTTRGNTDNKKAATIGDGQMSEYDIAVSNASERDKKLILRILGMSEEQKEAFLIMTQSPQNGQ